ncbi:hypothetical protein [Gelidibacter maritimus]|uniref:DUF4403 family protein n=1 Tax=Gelidibacter maritimus TaxID=2761487 RepID=A0A7W2M4X3_9FLAO|nr:hypothetical protein [Gelidibacter maritimus]MBA6152795.1 hypothetical protein [Gelidibacter maritimus]
MNSNSTTSNQDISVTLPVRIGFAVIESFLKKKYTGTTISKTSSRGKTSNYFKILDLNLFESQTEPYNLQLRLKLQTLTLLFNNKDIEVSVLTDLRLDIETQKLYVEAYNINSSGDHWIASNILKSVLNTFIYKKILNTLSVDLMPILQEKIDLVNIKLASELTATKNLSIMGNVEKFTISHFEIKRDVIWIFIDTQGWGVITIEDLEV